MKQFVFTIRVLIVLLIAGGCSEPEKNAAVNPAPSDQPATSSSEAMDTSYGSSTMAKLQAEFARLKEVVEMDPDQLEAITTWNNESMTTIRDWLEENGPAILERRKKALAAARNKDLRKLNQMKGDKEIVAKLVNQQRDMLLKHRQQFEGHLNTEQMKTWQSAIITENLTEFLKPLELSANQLDKISELSSAAIAGLNGKQLKENWRGYGTAALERLFESQVVDPAQKESFEELKKKNRTRMLGWGDRY